MLPLCGCSSSDEPSPDDANLAAVHGSVVIDGEPVNAAAILLTPGGGVKITGSDGLYNFTGLTPGKYELKVFKEGCQTQNSSIELTALHRYGLERKQQRGRFHHQKFKQYCN